MLKTFMFVAPIILGIIGGFYIGAFYWNKKIEYLTEILNDMEDITRALFIRSKDVSPQTIYMWVSRIKELYNIKKT
jgi:hypothetical protein